MAVDNGGWPDLDVLTSEEGRVVRKALVSLGGQQLEILGGVEGIRHKLDGVESAVTDIRNDVHVAVTDIRAEPVNYYPKSSIVINPSAAWYWLPSILTYDENAITVNGIWGYHAYYLVAWALASTLSGAINASTTTIAVTSSASYSAGHIVRCNDELMLVVTVATNSLTVIRAWNGSTAAAHDSLTTLPVWKTQADVARGCMIQAARYYKRNEAVFGTTGGGEMGTQAITIPLDPDVAAILDQYIPRF